MVNTLGKNKLRLLSSPSLHSFLVVIFFTIFRCTQAFFFLRLWEVVITLAILLLIVLLFSRALQILFKGRKSIAAIFLTLILVPSLFFTTVVDLFKRIGLVDEVQWNRETIVILLVFWLVCFVYLFKTKKNFSRFCQYLNILFSVLIVYQSATYVTRLGTLKETRQKLEASDRKILQPGNLKPVNDTLPDIYFLVFDGYTGNAALRTVWNFDNFWVTENLRRKKFHVSDSAISAYDNTHICLSSVFNMDYQVNWNRELGDSYWALTEYLKRIKFNQLSEILKRYDYHISNFSFFEFDSQPVFTTFKAYSASRNFYRFVLENSILLRFFNNPFNAEQGKNNLKVYQSIMESVFKDSGRKFVYGHFMLPHPAYFFDSSGNYFSNGKGKHKTEYENYLEQLKYTNTLISGMTDTILHFRPNSVIILQGDHGSRIRKTDDGKLFPGESNQPFSAIYFPNHGYEMVEEPFFTPNTFRVLLNKYFSAGLQLIDTKTNYFVMPE